MNNRKIGVVRTMDLVESYHGIEEARKVFGAKKERWRMGLDTLQQDFHYAVKALDSDRSSLSNSEQRKRQERIQDKEKMIVRYTQNVELEMRREEEQLQAEVLDLVNNVVKSYAEENGYDVVLGATIEGSILHSVDALDITDELIEAMNRNYKPTK